MGILRRAGAARTPADRCGNGPPQGRDCGPPRVAGGGLLGWHTAALGAILALGALLLVATWDRHYAASYDGISYLTSGANLLAGRGYVNQFGEPEVVFPPLYPVVAGLLTRLGFEPELAGRLVSAAAGLASIALVYGIGRALYSPQAALLAALIFTLMPIRTTARLGFALQQSVLSESLYVAMTLATAAAWIAFERGGRLRAAAAVGVLGSLSYLTRPEGLALLGMFALAVLVRRGRPAPRRVAAVALAFAAAALVASPYLIYLHRHTGRWRLSGKSGARIEVAVLGAAKVPWSEIVQFDPVTHSSAVPPLDVLARKYPQIRAMRSLPRRCLHNLREIADGFFFHFTPIELFLAGIGIFVVPWKKRHLALEIVLFSTWVYLGMAVILFLDPRFLYPAAPAIAVWAGSGLAWLFSGSAASDGSRAGRARWGAAGAVALVLVFAFAARPLRTELLRVRSGAPDQHKLAGLWLRERHLGGPVTATTPAVAFYAGQRAVFLPYIRAADVPQWARTSDAQWLVLTLDDQADPSLQQLAKTHGSLPGLRYVASGLTETETKAWVLWEIESPTPHADASRPDPRLTLRRTPGSRP